MTAPIIPGLEQVRTDEDPARHGRKVDFRQLALAALLIVPNLALIITFTYRPRIDNIWISFHHWNISSPRRTWVGLDNYIRFFQDPDSYRILWNTFVFTGVAVVGSMVLGLALAMLLDQKLRGRNIVRSTVFAPYVISGAAIGVAFQFVFDPNFGMIQAMLSWIGVNAPNFYQNPNWALFMVTTTYVWKNLGYTFVIYLAALQGRRDDLDEAAELDLTPAWRRFWRVTLPQLKGTTVFLSITVLLNSFQVFDIIQVMTKGGPLGIGTTTIVYQVYQETFTNSQAGYGAAVATIMFVIVLVITVLQARMQKER